jgi:hypothetical protein
MENLNKKQKEFLLYLVDIETKILETLNPYDMSETARLAIVLLDPQGWLFDDMVSPIKSYLQLLGQNENVIDLNKTSKRKRG